MPVDAAAHPARTGPLRCSEHPSIGSGAVLRPPDPVRIMGGFADARHAMDFDHTVAEVAALVGGRVEGSAERRLTGLRSVEQAGPDELAAYFRDPSDEGEGCRAGCLLVREDSGLAARTTRSLVRVGDPEEALDRVAGAWGPAGTVPAPGVHPAALVEEGAEVDATASVGPWVYLSRGARIGPGSCLLAGVYVGVEAVVGADCTLHPGVHLGARCELGDRVLVHPGAVIGADGFGYRQDASGRHIKSPQVGRVVVGDDVEIGANATIDRARLETTTIGAGTKLDDLVHIAHNCDVGEHCAMAAQVGVAGSTVIGRHVLIGGQAGVSDGRRIGDAARVGGGSAVIRDVPARAVFMGYPAVPQAEWKRQVLSLARLPDLIAERRRAGGQSRSEDRRGA